MCASVSTSAIGFGKYEDIVPLRRTKPVNAHVLAIGQWRQSLILPDRRGRKSGSMAVSVFEGQVRPDQRQLANHGSITS